MQPNARGMGPPASYPPTSAAVAASQIALHELQIQNPSLLGTSSSHFGPSASSHDDFLDQMLSAIPSWPDLAKYPWDLASTGGGKPVAGDDGLHFAPAYDESSLLASRLRQYQISSGGSPAERPMMMPMDGAQHHQQVLLSALAGRVPAPAEPSAANPSLLPPLPLSLGGVVSVAGDSDSSFKSPNSTGGDGLFNGFGASLRRSAKQTQNFHQPQTPQATSATAGTPAAGGSGQPGQRVRARRGQATDPHSIAERLRRERIAERMKALQELVPNANKTDKASMLDEIIDYVKFLQLQVKVLSMSRLGGAAATAPLVADNSSQGRGSTATAIATATATATEHQVARMMEEDMGSAMQYLQGKGLCLMPISLASAISTANRHVPAAARGTPVPSSPSFSVLTVHSAVAGSDGAAGDTDVTRSSGRDAASVSKP